jgi:hypothetical protein
VRPRSARRADSGGDDRAVEGHHGLAPGPQG